MKILQISNYYFPHIGGIEQTTRDCVNALSGHEVKVFCFNHEKGNGRDVIDGAEVVRAGCFAKLFSQSLSFGYAKLLKKTIEEFKPEVIIFHYPNPFAAHFLLKYLKKLPEIKLVLYWHLDIVKQKFLGKFFGKQNNSLLKRADKIVATSPNYIAGSRYLTRFKDKCVVISSCVSQIKTAYLQEKVSQIRSRYAGKIILFSLGRHTRYKGVEYLIRASKLLDDRFVILIGGQGEQTDHLKNLAKGDGKVVFLGRLIAEEVGAYLNACDIFCFPSITKNEAFGIALAEAMSCGKPAITFNIQGSGVNYVSLDGVTGIEVENRNVGKYAQAIVTLAENPKLRIEYGNAARRRYEENFTFEQFKTNINKLMDNI